MHPSLQREIPDFLHSSIVCCDNFSHNKHKKSCFLFTKDLKFYEFRRKQLLQCIDLSQTHLSPLMQRIRKYDGRKYKCLGDLETETSASEKPYDIKIEKYIFRNFDVSKLFLLLLCWDKLIVLNYPEDTSTINSFRIIAQYENVKSIKVMLNSVIKYQAVLSIKFRNGHEIITNFQQDQKGIEHPQNEANILEKKGEVKQLLERVQQAKAELQFHKEITHRLFKSLKNKQTFGNNFLRSTRLDEKPMLTRCGDLWLRITSGDDLVIGLPLVNNCTPPNLTVIKNLRPILIMEHESECANSNGLSYVYRVYHLHQTFENLETMETFFQSENNQSWVAAEEQILPGSFVVFTIKFKLSQLMMFEEQWQLFVRFQIEKDLQVAEPEQTHIFEQHIFIKSLDFQEILHARQDYEINFNIKTLHQDFLAVAISSFATQLQIEFSTGNDGNKFEQLLAQKFNFELVHRYCREDEVCNEDDDDDDGKMEVDEVRPDRKRLPCTLFYNRKPNSLWFGVLIQRYADHYRSFNACDNFLTTWVFFNKNEENSFLMFKLIFSELITYKCNVVKIKHGINFSSSDARITQMGSAIRQELAVLLDIINNENVMREKIKLLFKLQYNTDIMAASQCHDIKK